MMTQFFAAIHTAIVLTLIMGYEPGTPFTASDLYLWEPCPDDPEWYGVLGIEDVVMYRTLRALTREGVLRCIEHGTTHDAMVYCRTGALPWDAQPVT